MAYDPQLIGALEPSQLTVATEVPLPRRALGRGAFLLMIALRVYIVIAIPIVIYAFFHAIVTPQ